MPYAVALLMRFALKCLPPTTAARVILGELLRLPRHPRPIAHGVADVLLELPEILASRSRLSVGATSFDQIAKPVSTLG